MIIMKHFAIPEAVILFCAIFNAYLFVRGVWPSPNVPEQHPHIYSYVGDDYPEYLPLDGPVRTGISMTIEDPPDFPISGPGAAEKWMSIYPPGYGFVRLGDRARVLCVAMFHELHCIEKMRVFLDDPSNEIVTFPHQQHCMNYLRQLFLCATDMTLEPISGLSRGEALDPNVDLSVRSGPGVTYSCGDWEAIYSTVGSNYVSWNTSWNVSSL